MPRVLHDIIEMVMDPDWLGDTDISVPQISVLKGLYGLPMRPEEREAFEGMTEGRKARKGGYFDATLCIGQRSGKTEKIGANVALYQALTFNRETYGMAPGEIPYIAAIAQNQEGAAQIFGYVEGKARVLEDKDIQVLVESDRQSRPVTGDQIRFASGAVFQVFASKKASTRNKTMICGLADEVAWWETELRSVNSDTEIIRSLRGRMITVRQFAKLLIHSSPYKESGVLYDHFAARGTARRLFAMAPSWVFNPKYDKGPQAEEIAEMRVFDHEGYLRDYGAQFGKAGGQFYGAAEVDAAMGRDRPFTMPPEHGHDCRCWIDTAFKHDLFAAAIGYRDGESIVYPCVMWWEPRKGAPLDGRVIAAELAEMLKSYGIDRVKADQYADIPFGNDLATHGIRLETEAKTTPKSYAMHSNFRSVLRRGAASLPKDDMIRKDILACQVMGKGNNLAVEAPHQKGFHDDITKVLAALAQDLLPMGCIADMEELNSGAMSDRDRLFRERGFPLPDSDREDRLPTDILSQVY